MLFFKFVCCISTNSYQLEFSIDASMSSSVKRWCIIDGDKCSSVPITRIMRCSAFCWKLSVWQVGRSLPYENSLGNHDSDFLANEGTSYGSSYRGKKTIMGSPWRFTRESTISPLQKLYSLLIIKSLFIHKGYLRWGFEYFLEGFAPPHFLAEITTFQVELDEHSRFHYSIFRPNIPNSQKSAKAVKKPLKNTSNFVKPVAIRLEMLSNFLIDLPSRTRRALSNGHIFSSS